MPKFEINPGRGRRVWAVVLAIVGVGSLLTSRLASSRIVAAVMLLAAWEMAFVPSLPLNLRIGEIYQRARKGWRMSPTSRVLTYVNVALIIFATYLQLHGR